MAGTKRWFVLLGAVCSIALAVAAFIGAFLAYGQDWNQIDWRYIVIASFVFVTMQAIFVLPLVTPPKLSSKGMPLNVSIIIAGFMGGALCVIFASATMSIMFTLLLGQNGEGDHFGYAPVLYSLGWIFDDGYVPDFLYPLIFIVVSWFLWSVLLLIYIHRRKRDPGVLVKITSWIFAGSLVELLLSIPLFVMVNKKSDCYCSTGSFAALVLSVFTSLWLFGPCMVILLIWRKRPWTKDHCFSCGYPRKTTAENCSECGTKFC